MHQRSIVRIGVPLAVAALALTARGSRDDSGGSSGGSDGGGGTKTVKIGVVAPLSGDLSALGLGIRTPSTSPSSRPTRPRSPRLDDQARRPGRQGASPTSAAERATKLVGDDDVVGVVGPLNSGVASRCSRCSAARTSSQISPANTGPTLTQGPDCAPTRSARTRPTSVPPPRTPSRARSPRSTCTTTGRQEGRDHPRQEDLRPGSGRRLHDGVQEARRQDRRRRDDQPRRQGLLGRRHQGQGVQPRRSSTTAASTRGRSAQPSRSRPPASTSR